MSSRIPQLLTWTISAKICIFSIKASMLILRGQFSPSKMPLQSSTIFNMKQGGKKWFFHNRVYVNDCRANFHLQKFKKKYQHTVYLKLFHVNVGLANFCSMLNLCGHFLVLRTITVPCSMLACESICLHVLTLTWNKFTKKRS